MKINRKKILGFLCAALVLLLASSTWLVLAASHVNTASLKTGRVATYKKPIIVLLYDSLMTEPLQQAMKEGKVPAFSYLAKHGKLYPEVVSSYPTMSVSIDSTLLTGTYGDQHKIPGLIWFNEQQARLISYGSGLHETWDKGVKQVLENGVLKLNGEHLSTHVRTIYEELGEESISSGSINGIIYRGDTEHTLHPPNLWSSLHILPQSLYVSGPDHLSIGILSQFNKRNDKHNYAWNRFGFNNDFTVEELTYLIDHQSLPAFTLAYLPDADSALHQHGPGDIDAIVKADQSLQQILNHYSSWENALSSAVWVVLGDSSQSFVGEVSKQSYIELEDTLAGYSFWRNEQQNAELALALNERMAYIHLLDANITKEEVVKKLKEEERIQFIAWREKERIIVSRPKHSEVLMYSQGGAFTDRYQQHWNIAGDYSLLDLSIAVSGNSIDYDQFPDGLARLYGALNAQEGDIIIVDAKPGYEFSDHDSYNHAGGGSHGSLHKVDSIVPLLAAGTSRSLKDQRIVALKEWLLELVREQQIY